ncbi:MAG: hypothetical protein ACYTGN_04580 [Planctomycetota bacterium]|jgi:hypothetical protein
MRLAALALVMLAAPGDKSVLKYVFHKGMKYDDKQERVIELTLIPSAEHKFVWNKTRQIHLRRTILGVDDTAHPTSERVEVLKFRDIVKESPEQDKVGTHNLDCEGKTFVWSRLETRWGLFDRGEEGKAVEVTAEHKDLVEQLKNWRDARLPADPIGVGGTWQVGAKEFLETSGTVVPDGARGTAIFRLAALKESVATIPFEFVFSYKVKTGERFDVAQKGTWEFDVEKGRDVSFRMEAGIQVDKGAKGNGRLVMRRAVTYSE